MKQIYISMKDFTEDASPVIRRAVESASEDTEIVFEKGIYPMNSAVDVFGKKNFILNGNGSTIVAYFNREADVSESTEIFHFDRCSNTALKGFKVTSTVPVNSTCTILDVQEKYVDIEADSTVPFNGKEYYIDGMAFYRSEDPEENGENRAIGWLNTDYIESERTVIAGELACTNPKRQNVPHESLGGQRFRVYPKNFEKLEKGMSGIIQHSYYGIVAFTFKNTEDMLIEDVHIANYGGFGFIILPRCRNFTFRRLRFESEDKVHQIYSANADGIHITGLSGKLVLEDCYFEALGDDTINVHTQVLDVTEVGKERFRLVYAKAHGIISESWGKPGDVLKVYDRVNLREKGEVVLKEITDGWVTPEKLDFEISAGDLVTNRFYFPDVTVKGTSVLKQRNRSMCMQSVKSLLVEDCDFSHVGNASVYLSSAFNVWREAGPVSNVTVRNCRFSTQIHPMERAYKVGVVTLWLRGDEYYGLPHVFRNLTVENNIFNGFDHTAVFVSSADGVTVRNNIFRNCSFGEEDPVLIENCSDVIVKGNHLVNE